MNRKTKSKISCTITTQLISVLVFATKLINSSILYVRIFKSVASFYGCWHRAGGFVPDLVQTPEYIFSAVKLIFRDWVIPATFWVFSKLKNSFTLVLLYCYLYYCYLYKAFFVCLSCKIVPEVSPIKHFWS